ncbi:MAG: enoyl-CoA hydratase/isomerase family protein [Gammaproteobacteria bacterium]|nr:enoyl-CoA hydratase/isomerase family protein [Gammaproteobacteria bacterium]
MSDQGAVRYRRDGSVAHVVFDRPEARNAMTWTMYEQLAQVCHRIVADPEVRCAVFRGAGGKAFVAGTDIGQFRDFSGADDGVEYEEKMEAHLSAVESLPVPTLAVIEGYAIGGGLAIATACDIRIGTPDARFGVPIARTVGNCLSIGNIALLNAAFGVGRTKKMLMLAELLTADEAVQAGFLAEIVPPESVDARAGELAGALAGNAPVTLRVTKEAIRRLLHAGLVDDEDLIRQAYGSRDFKLGVEAFVNKQKPQWTGN